MQGRVAQGRTIQETIEIARDAAKRLIEAQMDAGGDTPEGTLRAVLKQAGIDTETFLQQK